jgi:hypothetical protein
MATGSVTTTRCPNCGTVLHGAFCHGCGQRRIEGRLTTPAFLREIARRVLRSDESLLKTMGRSLRAPGILARDYLAGRRREILDPVHYFLAILFVQVVAGALTRVLAPLVGREAALEWLGTLGRMIVIKMGIILWAATVWRVLFRPRYNVAELSVFAIYVFGTIGLLWALLPLIELASGLPLAAHRMLVVAVALAIELAYVSYAVRDFTRSSVWCCVVCAFVLLGSAYGLLVLTLGSGRALGLSLPEIRMLRDW